MTMEWTGQASASVAENKPERKSGIMRVVNAGDKEAEVLDEFEKIFNNEQDIDKYEIPKTEEELKMIGAVNRAVAEFIPKFGGIPIVVNSENVHMIDFSKLPKDKQKKYFKYSGFYTPMLQGIVIFPSLKRDRAKFIVTLVHEMLHLNSFQSAKKINNEVEMNRVGFGIYSPKNNKIFFKELEEQIICELTTRICSNFLAKNEMANLLAGYADHLGPLEHTMEIIYNDNKDQFKSKEDVFHEFVRVSLTGKLKNVAKLIESTFGKGSFKKGAYNSATDLEDNVENK